jgi:hypothetical protein
MDEQEKNLAYQKERDQMFYRERAVDQALVLMKQNRDSASAESLVHNANVIYNFIKGTPNE